MKNVAVTPRWFLSVCWLALGCGGADAPPEPLGESPQAVVDGDAAIDDTVFSTVAVVNEETDSLCTGTLIAPRVVVTAAHCVVTLNEAKTEILSDAAPKNMTVLVGHLDLNEAWPTEKVFAVETINRNQGFKLQQKSVDPSFIGQANDIAILCLTEPAPLTPAYIPTMEELSPVLVEGAALTVEGYGVFDFANDRSGVLHLAEIPLTRIVGGEFEAGTLGGSNACFGDSGGPAYMSVNGRQALIGASSRLSFGDDECGAPAVFTLLPRFDVWLAKNTCGLYTAPPPKEPASVEPSGEGEGSSCSTSLSPAPRSTLSLLIPGLLAAVAARRRKPR